MIVTKLNDRSIISSQLQPVLLITLIACSRQVGYFRSSNLIFWKSFEAGTVGARRACLSVLLLASLDVSSNLRMWEILGLQVIAMKSRS